MKRINLYEGVIVFWAGLLLAAFTFLLLLTLGGIFLEFQKMKLENDRATICVKYNDKLNQERDCGME